MADAPTLELVLKRNSIERLKRDKFPLDIVNELPDIIERGYENISEEDVVRFMWYGLYHDKPKVGYFMMRVKIPSGILNPEQFRMIGELSRTYGRNEGELSTRQNVQLHWIKLDYLPDIFAKLASVGLTTVGGCGDAVRNITGCPVAGIDRDEIFDCTQLIKDSAAFFYGHRVYSDLPRKHKISISTCACHCNAPEINCISLIGTIKDGRKGYAVRVGGGLSTVPRVSKHMGVFVPEEDSIDVLKAILDAWRTNLKYRLSRVKARLKFMVDDFGAEGMRAETERELGRKLEDLPETPQPAGFTEHVGINAQKQPGLSYIGFPVYCGRITGEQIIQIADIAKMVGGDVRLTRQQNFIVANVADADVQRVIEAIGLIGFPLDVSRLHATAIGCTGSPLCNYAVAETKTKLDELLQHIEGVFGRTADDVLITVDGCPHACAHHWIADIGLQGSTLRERGVAGEKLEAYEIYLRGGIGGPNAAIGRPIIRRIPEGEAKFHVERLLRSFLDNREANEPFKSFAERHSDEQLIAFTTGQSLEAVMAASKSTNRGAARAADDPNA